jgi:Uma2 family endonuclease
LVIDVRSEFDRWSKLFAKASEYLDAGVGVVCLLDPDSDSIYVVRGDQPPLKLGQDEELTLPELHDSFRVPVRQFFE